MFLFTVFALLFPFPIFLRTFVKYFFEIQPVKLFTINSNAMKNVVDILLIFLFASLILASGCKKKSEEPTPTHIAQVPVLSTSAVSNISATTASCGGSITSDAGFTVSARGVCWSTGTTPTIADSKTTDGIGAGSFTSAINGLSLGTNYFVRAYATNSEGTGYGSAMAFTTSSTLAVGMSYQGGKVAYIFAPGDPGYIAGQQHGIIAAPSDQSYGAAWGCDGTLTNASGTAIGSGSQNTQFIWMWCADVGIAATICYDLVLDGYSDWYLPSKDELNKLYLNKTAIGISTAFYWSSSEFDNYQAWDISFVDGQPFISWKSDLDHVRAVRTF